MKIISRIKEIIEKLEKEGKVQTVNFVMKNK